MSERLADVIKSRGYWQVVIRPTTFIENRVKSFEALYSIVQRTSVQLRGWDFPHIDREQQPIREQDWIGQEFAWEHFREIWRLYQSGQFAHISAFPYDWRDLSSWWPVDEGWEWGRTFSIADALFRFTEIYEFAARLALSDAGDDQMEIQIALGNLTNRTLDLDFPRRVGFFRPKIYTADTAFETRPSVYARDALIGQARELALTSASELFMRFGWEPSIDQLRDLQAELRIG